MTNRASVATTSTEVTRNNNAVRLDTHVEQAAPRLSLSPASANLDVPQGGSASLVATLRNSGLVPLTNPIITAPPHLPWVAVDKQSIGTLLPGQSATLTITAAPGASQASGYYRDLLDCRRIGRRCAHPCAQRAACLSPPGQPM